MEGQASVPGGDSQEIEGTSVDPLMVQQPRRKRRCKSPENESTQTLPKGNMTEEADVAPIALEPIKRQRRGQGMLSKAQPGGSSKDAKNQSKGRVPTKRSQPAAVDEVRGRKQRCQPKSSSVSPQVAEEGGILKAKGRIKREFHQRRSTASNTQARAQCSAVTEEPGTTSLGKDESSACLETFRRHSDDLITNIQDPEVLALSLSNHDVITNTVVKEVCVPTLSPIQRKVLILAAVRDKITCDCRAFDLFLLVLSGDSHLKELAQRMRQTCDECQTHSLRPPSELSSKKEGADAGVIGQGVSGSLEEDLLPVTGGDKLIKQSGQGTAGGVPLSKGRQTESLALDDPKGTLLRADNFKVVYQALYSARKKWEVIGLELGMNKEDLDNIRDDFGSHGNDKCLSEMISQWLKARITHRPSWQKIVQALLASTVGEEGLACDIKEKYTIPKMSGGQASGISQAKALPTSTHPPTPSQSPIATYASYLQFVYLRQKFPIYGKLPHSPSTKYTNLASVKKVPVSKQQADAFTRATIRGDIDDVARKKEPVRMDEIATVQHGKWPRCILVEGAPGIGKSTFAWKMCRKWGKGKILQHYRLVILLRLREKKVREATCVSDLFYFYNRQVREQVINEVEETGGKGVLLLFEGYDELPSELRTENSLFLDIVQGKELPQATVLITSRPSASGFLYEKCKDYISQHIEILGFTHENVQSYVNSTCGSDPSLLSGIQKYLQYYPHIRTMMYVPLNAAIVVEVYRTSKKDKSDVPKTMTQLYDCLVRSLLRRYLNDHPVHGKQKWRIRTFKDLPSDMYEQLCELGRIAYEGIENGQQLIFDDLTESFETLGLMQCVPELYVDEGATFSHSFLHLTVQEFMAAFHLSVLPEERHAQQFKNKPPNQRMVLKFLAGLTGLTSGILGNPDMFEMLDLDNIHWVFESQRNCDVLNAQYIWLYLSWKTLTTFDCYMVGYCISHSECTWRIDMQCCHIGDKDIEGLVQGVLEGQSGGEIVQGVLEGQSGGDISELNLRENEITSEGIGHLLKLPTLSLRKLAIGCDNELTPECVEGIVRILQPLGELDLSTSQFTDNCISLTSALKSDGTLECSCLRLRHCNIGPFETDHLASALKDNTTLTLLDMGGNWIEDTGAITLAEAIAPNRSLESLHICNCGIGSEGTEHLADTLRENNTLQELDMSCNHIGDTGASAIAGTLIINKSLKMLNISGCDIRSEGAECLAHVLQKNNTLEDLDISYNPIEVTGATVLAEALTINKSLRRLYINDDSVGADGTQNLVSSLKKNTTLQSLWLPKKYEYVFRSETYNFRPKCIIWWY